MIQLRAIEEHGLELRRQQRDMMKQKVEEWNRKRKENGEEVIEGDDYSAIYEQMSAQERYKDAQAILAPIENSYKQLETYMDRQGLNDSALKAVFSFKHDYWCIRFSMLLCYLLSFVCWD